MDHGLKALDTFGVDVLVDTVRASISPKKATVKRWLEIAAMARQLELPVTARIEAGPIERLSQRVRHFEVLRWFLEKHPGTFSKLVPQMWAKPLIQPVPPPGLAYTNYSHRLKLIAVSRLFLGSLIADQQVCWLPDQVEEAQEALSWGANDFGCTDSLAYYRFLSGQMTGFETRNGFTESEFAGLIRETGSSC
jgi:cyclic dehypoxanthinyl futalosine synthase